MKILLIVHFHQMSNHYRYPSSRTGMYALVTDDESVLDFHGLNKNGIPIGTPMWKRLDDYFFSEYWANKWRSEEYINKKFKPAAEVIAACGTPDKIILVEV